MFLNRKGAIHGICRIFIILCFTLSSCFGVNSALLQNLALGKNSPKPCSSHQNIHSKTFELYRVNGAILTTNALDEQVFDNLYRLTNEAISGGTVNGTIGYTFDKVSNRTSRTSNVTGVSDQVHSHSANDLLSHHTYDSNGSTTESPDLVNNSGVTNDVYDFRNKLVRRTSSSGDTIEFLYNADGHRVRKEVKTGGIHNTALIFNYLVDNNNPTGYSQVVEEFNRNGILERNYHIGHQRFAMSDHVNGGDISYYSFDGHGSIRGLTNESGDVIEEYDFDSYGILIGFRKDTGSGLVEEDPNSLGVISRNEFLFAGEQWDGDMGMYYNRARYYDVENGRFNSFDTWEGSAGKNVTLNKYLYANGNGVSYIDPTGYYSLAETQTAQGIQNTLQKGLGLVAKLQRVYDQSQRFIQLYEYVSLIRDLAGIFVSSGSSASLSASFTTFANSRFGTGVNASSLVQGLNEAFGAIGDDFSSMLGAISERLPEIALKASAEGVKHIVKATQLGTIPYISLPAGTSSDRKTRFLVLSGRGGKEMALGFSTGGGSLIGTGLYHKSRNRSVPVARIDYWDGRTQRQGRPGRTNLHAHYHIGNEVDKHPPEQTRAIAFKN